VSEHVPLVSLEPQHRVVREELAAAFERVHSRSRYILSEEVMRFESAFASFCGSRHCIAVGSGTDALHLSLAALGIGAGDEVILPSHTFAATALAVHYTGATPVLVDVDPATYTLDVSHVERALSPRTKAVIPVHLYGRLAEMEPIVSLARERGFWVVEDAAQAHGAERHGQRAGTRGDLGCFSFYPTKNLGALGDGGAIVTDDDTLDDRLRRLRDYGQTEKYRSEIVGFNSRLDELQAAILTAKLPWLEAWNDERRALVARYAERLDPEVAQVPSLGGIDHVHHLFVVEIAARDRVRRECARRGVETGIHYPVPVHRQPFLRDVPHRVTEVTETERVAARVLSLPLYPGLEPADVDRVAATLSQVVRNVG
jgi:dTDP-4-amino-4,6-dideoxygalactose transaminase